MGYCINQKGERLSSAYGSVAACTGNGYQWVEEEPIIEDTSVVTEIPSDAEVIQMSPEELGQEPAFQIERAKEIERIRLLEAKKRALAEGLATQEAEEKSTSVLPKGGIDDIIKTVSDDSNDLDEMSLKTKDGAKITVQNQRGKIDTGKSNVVQPMFPTISGTRTKGQATAEKGTPPAVSAFLTGTPINQTVGSSVVPSELDQPSEEEQLAQLLPSPDFGPYLTEEPASDLGLPITEELMSTGISPEFLQGGPQIGPSVDDSSFVDEMDRRLSEAGSGISDFAGDAGQVIGDVATSGAEGIVDGAQWLGGVAGDAGQMLGDATIGAGEILGDTLLDTGEFIGDAASTAGDWVKQAFASSPEEDSIKLEIVADPQTAIANLEQVMEETGAINDEAVVDAVNTFVDSVDSLVDQVGSGVLPFLKTVGSAVIGVPVLAFNSLTQEFEEEEEPKVEETKFESTELVEEGALPEPEDTADWIGDLMAAFTELTGITSKDLIRALIMYAGSRLLGYSGHDSVQFAYKDWETQVENRMSDNEDSRKLIANTDNLFNEIEKLEAFKTQAIASGDKTGAANADRRIAKLNTELGAIGSGSKDSSAIQNFKYFTSQKKAYDDQLASGAIDSTTHEALMDDLNGMMKKRGMDLGDRLALKGAQHGFTTAEIIQKGRTKAQTGGEEASYKKVVDKQVELSEKSDAGWRMIQNNSQISRMLDETDIQTGPFLGNIRQGLRAFSSETLGLNIDEAASGEMVTKKTMDFVIAYIQNTKGAISEKEMQAFEKASAGHHMTPAGIRLLIATANRFAENDIKRNKYLNNWVKQVKEDGGIPSVEGMSDARETYNSDNPMVLPTAGDIAEAGNEENQAKSDSIDSATSREELMAIVSGLGGSKGMTEAQQEAAEAKLDSFE